jgi:hypothetical protein
MKLALPGKAQAAARIEVLKGRSVNPLHVGQSGAMHGTDLALEHVFRVLGGNKEVPVQPLKIADNLLFSNDGLDTIDRRRVTGGCEPRSRLAEEPFKFAITVVERVGEMCGGAAGLAPTDGAGVQHDDGFSLAREQIGRRHPRDSSADNADIRMYARA